MKRKMGIVSLCAVTAICLSGCIEGSAGNSGRSANGTDQLIVENIYGESTQNSQSSQSANITEAKAKEIALGHAGLSADRVTFTKSKLDYDDGAAGYEIEFVSGSKEYEYEIRASDGKILESSVETIGGVNSQGSQTAQTANITEAKAKEIALEHAGLSADRVTFTKSKLDYDDGAAGYEIEFVSGSMEYEYEIRASDGKILESSVEAIGGVNSQGSQTAQTANITEAKAKEIALGHAGLSADRVTFTKSKLDYDDGAAEYEIEFVSGFREYEYEIRASDGKILESSVETIGG